MSENQEYNKEKTETPGELENEIKKAVVGAEIIHETTKYTKESNGGKLRRYENRRLGRLSKRKARLKDIRKEKQVPRLLLPLREPRAVKE